MLLKLTRILSLLSILILAGCQTTSTGEGLKTQKAGSHSKKSGKGSASTRVYPQRNDGAPKGPPPTFFQKVKPIFESFSRYGNPESYVVDGRSYQVLRSGHGYKARGMASWYGTKFHSQRTSSGEKYNMYAMTAAHRTLPLPSYVRVKNLQNGRVAIVKVNDRGPFHSSRVIDLSYAAATKLGLLPHGTAMVEIEAVNVMKGGKPHVAHYYVQAGAFSSRQSAQALKGKLSKLTKAPVIVEPYQKRYVVKAGPFTQKNMSDQFKKQLASRGIRGAMTILQ